MRFVKVKNLFMPAFLIVAVIGILIVFITISTRENLNRDKNHFVHSARIRGEAIIFSLEGFLKVQKETGDVFFKETEAFIEEIKARFNVSYLYMIDAAGIILIGEKPSHASENNSVGLQPEGIFEIIIPSIDLPESLIKSHRIKFPRLILYSD